MPIDVRVLVSIALLHCHPRVLLAQARISESKNVEEALILFEEGAKRGDLSVTINRIEWRYHDPQWEGVTVDLDSVPPQTDILTDFSDKLDVAAWVLKRKDKWILIVPGKDTTLESLLSILAVCNEAKISYSLQRIARSNGLRLNAFEKNVQTK